MKAKLLFLLLFGYTLLTIKAQTALNFDGTNDYVLGTNNASLNLTQGTVEAWIKTSGAGTGYRGIIVKQYNYGIFLNSNKLIAFEWISGSIKNTNINLANGIWHHVAFTFQSEVVNGSKLYIDGNPVLTFTYKIGHFDRTIAVGNGKDDTSVSQFFNGEIDKVRVWNTARTDAEILANYNKCLLGNETGLIMYWNFDEGNGTTVTDVTSNNNHGTLTNMDAASDWVNGYDCSLVAYYPFNGNANDESGNNHHGTVSGPTLTIDRFGNEESAYHYHGNLNNDYIDIGDWENGGPMTINIWAKWDVFNNWGVPFDIGNGRNSDNIGIGNKFTSNILTFYVLNGATKHILYSEDTTTYPNSPLTLNAWTMITCTVDETGLMKAYKNSELIGTFNGFTPTKMVRTAQYLGSYNYPENEYFQGDLDDVRIYQSVLTDAEILNLYTYNTLKVEKIENIVTSNFYVNNNILHFKNTQNLTEIKNVEVYNLLGQKVFKTNTITTKVHLSSLQKGIYILKVEKNFENYSTLKFLIN